MNLSGILVITAPDQVEACMAQLNALPGVDVHHSDIASGKIVATQEAEKTEDEVEGLKRIKALPGVLMAEMVYHYFEEDKALEAQMPADLDKYQGLKEIPVFKNKS